MSASSSDTSRGSTGRRLDGPAMGQRLHQSTCAFWLGEHCYGIDIAVVGEIVEVDALAAVPMAPVPVRGLFNLRGTPIALVDPTKLLNLPEPPMNDEPRPGRPLNALVLRTETVLVGLLIRRMEMVLTSGKGVFTASEATDAEHPVVVGFLELAERGELTVTVLAAEAILDHVDRLKYVDTAAS